MILSDLLEYWIKNPNQPVDVELGDKSIRLDKTLRHLPDRRLTCLATWENKTVVAKFFYGKRHNRQTMKEAETLKALLKAGIETPKLLYVENIKDASVLVIEYIEGSISLLDWLKSDPKQVNFESVLTQTTQLILACHQAGFKLEDPHLENFLISSNKVFVIDAGGIHQSNAPLNDDSSMDNLALLYAQLPVTRDIVAREVLNKILNRSSSLELDWQQRLIKQRLWRQEKFIDKKVYRECTAYTCEKSLSRFLVAKRDKYTEDFKQALLTPDALIENGYLLKNGNTATVARVTIAGKLYVLKRYNIKKRMHSYLRGFVWSRASVSWRNGLLLEMLGIPTAKSYAFIEERCGPMRRRSYLLSEYIDAPQAWDVYESEHFSEEEKKGWAEKIVELFFLLKSTQISHGDLKAQNILCGSERAILIDLDGLKSGQTYGGFLKQFSKDIARFYISWPNKWKMNPYFIKYEKMLLNPKID